MVVRKYLQYLQFEKRYSDNTQKAYHKDLSQFSLFIQENYDLDDITKVNHQMIRSWLVHLLENQISPRSVNRKITTLKSFFKYLIKTGVVSVNPMNKVLSPKTSKKLPAFVEDDKINSFFEEVDFGEDFEGVRNKLIIEVLYGTGIRLSELVNIKDVDFDPDNATLKVLGKRNKERIIPLSPHLKKQISEYRIVKSQEFDLQNEFLFVTSKGRKLYPKLVYRVVKSFLGMITTSEKKSPHVLRHTFATHMLNNGADLNAIKELLGHASLAATQVYTHNSIEKLKSIYKQAHPKA